MSVGKANVQDKSHDTFAARAVTTRQHVSSPSSMLFGIMHAQQRSLFVRGQFIDFVRTKRKDTYQQGQSFLISGLVRAVPKP
jgi:Gpi18-like mannosyltransferase